MTDPTMDTTERRKRRLLLAGAARAYGANFDYSCANCGEGEADHDDDGLCLYGKGTTYERRTSPPPVTIPVRTDATLSGDDAAGTDDHNRRV